MAKGGRLGISCAALPGRRVRVRVEDTGVGIATENLTKIFELYYTTKERGTGMGLSICRSVVKAHGGTIQASSAEPFGAVFEICLPLEGMAAPLQATPAETTTFRFATGN